MTMQPKDEVPTDAEAAEQKLPLKIRSMDDVYRVQIITSAMRAAYQERRRSAGAPATLSAKTVELYAIDATRLGKRAIKNGRSIWTEAADTTSVRTWSSRRAAISRTIFDRMGKLKDVINRERESDPVRRSSREEIVSAANDLLLLANIWKAMPTGTPLTRRSCRRSKKYQLRGLPETWRLQLAKRFATSHSPYLLPFLTMAATGLRPAELQAGVTVSATRTISDDVTVRIQGAKVRSNSGQPWRELTLSTAEGAIGHEFLKCWEAGGRPTKISLPPTKPSKKNASGRAEGSKAAFARAMSYAASKIWPSKKDGTTKALTPYSLRNSLAQDLRAAGHSREEIAEALGHLTTERQADYGGKKGGGKGSAALKKTSAARSIKQTTTPSKTFDTLPKGKKNGVRLSKRIKP